ncbi:hypothetical protein V6Z11_A06G001300 [Gossypium hirsutum]
MFFHVRSSCKYHGGSSKAKLISHEKSAVAVVNPLHHVRETSNNNAGEKGLSVSELEKLPKVTGKDLVLGTECAVCLDEIEAEQSARMVPGCNHGFHLQCADTWLSKNSVCPVCRAKLEPKLFDPPDRIVRT